MLGLCCRLLRLGSFRRQGLLLRDRLSFGLLGFFLLSRGFLRSLCCLLCGLLGFRLSAFRLSFGSFSLFLGLLGIGAAFGFRFCVRSGLGLARFGCSFIGRGFRLSFILAALF